MSNSIRDCLATSVRTVYSTVVQYYGMVAYFTAFPPVPLVHCKHTACVCVEDDYFTVGVPLAPSPSDGIQ